MSHRSKFLLLIIGAVLVCTLPLGAMRAQEKTNVNEPPVPVYIISPYHEDSIAAAGEKGMRSDSQANAALIKKIDTLQQQAHQSSAESTAHFIWLYTLVALLGLMNIVLLFSSSHIRKELVQMRHIEHQRLLMAAETSAQSQPPPKILETPIQQEPPLLPAAPARTRKPRTTKPRIKKVK